VPARGLPLTRVLTLLAAALAVVLAVGGLPARGQSTGQRLGANRDRAASLSAAVAAETRRIGATQAGLDAAQARLDGIEADLEARRTQQRRVGAQIVAARLRLERLENRMRASGDALERNLVDAYENPPPDIVSVVLRARSFSDLLSDAEFRRRVADQNADILTVARRMRVEVAREASRLVVLQARVQKLAAAIAQRRDAAATVRTALMRIQQRQLARRAGTAARLRAVRAHISVLAARERREARRAIATQRTAAAQGITTDAGGTAQPPPGAPAAVAKVMAAGNAIAGLPYVWGGGHGSFRAGGYDCSGSVSYALAAAGLLGSPLDSTGFMSWGEPGPGRWITVYANAGHAYMIVAGWRFDTSALSGGGTRWTRAPRSSAGFVARHPPGL